VVGSSHFVKSCPTCGRTLQVQVRYLGREVTCGHCHGRFLAFHDDLARAPMTGDGLTADGLTADGLTADGLTGDGLTADGPTRDTITRDTITRDTITRSTMARDASANLDRASDVMRRADELLSSLDDVA